MVKPRILVVDDERVVIEVLSNLLEDPDREIVTAETATAALDQARAGDIAVALVDKNLGSASGIALCRHLKQMQPELEVILITGFASIESAIEAVQIGAFDYLTKPITDFSASTSVWVVLVALDPTGPAVAVSSPEGCSVAVPEPAATVTAALKVWVPE